MIVIGAALTVTLRPTAFGSPPKRRCQKPDESTTTGCAPGVWSSEGAIMRPSSGAIPSVGK